MEALKTDSSVVRAGTWRGYRRIVALQPSHGGEELWGGQYAMFHVVKNSLTGQETWLSG